jgi:multiple sugar transport system permease protein
LVNTYVPLILPNFLGPAFGVFLMRQFFKTIPRDIEDAAKLDGCTPFGIYWRIFLPLSLPAMAALTIFELLRTWNNLLLPLVYLRDHDRMTLPVGLTWLTGQYFSDLPLLMTATTVSILPIMVLFVFLQKYFVKGVALTGVNG